MKVKAETFQTSFECIYFFRKNNFFCSKSGRLLITKGF